MIQYMGLYKLTECFFVLPPSERVYSVGGWMDSKKKLYHALPSWHWQRTYVVTLHCNERLYSLDKEKCTALVPTIF